MKVIVFKDKDNEMFIMSNDFNNLFYIMVSEYEKGDIY